MKTIVKFILLLIIAVVFNISVNAQFKLNSLGQISVGVETNSWGIDTISTIKINGINNLAPRIAFGNTSELTIGKFDANTRQILLHATEGVRMTSLDGYTFFSYYYAEPFYHTLNLNCEVNVNSIYSRYDALTVASDYETSSIDALCDITNTETSNIKTGSKNQSSAVINAEILELYFPGTVKTDSVGQIYINYNKLIPILINAIVDLKGQLDTGNSEIINNPIATKSTNNGLATIEALEASIIEPKLYQNSPNPFNAETSIRYTLPENVVNAELYIYNLQGNQIKKYVISERGENSIQINASELDAGMYIYALIVDGKEIDTKRMILTE